MDFLANIWNSPSRYMLILIALVIIIYIPAMMVYMKKRKQTAGRFLEDNPSAAKVFIAGRMSGTLTVLSVNDDVPNHFYEGTKQGFFLLPGDNTLEVQYGWTRPGVLYKTVTTTVGPNKIQVAAAANKSYNINYDKKQKNILLRK